MKWKAKERFLQESIESMSQEADKLAAEVESKDCFVLAKSNAFRLKERESEEEKNTKKRNV